MLLAGDFLRWVSAVEWLVGAARSPDDPSDPLEDPMAVTVQEVDKVGFSWMKSCQSSKTISL